MRILWLSNVPSPYRVDFFNELGMYCNLTVLFEMATSTERDPSWKQYHFIDFRGIILHGKKIDVDKAVCLSVLSYLKKHTFDFIIVSNLATPTGILAIEYMKLCNIPYILEGDGGFAKNGKGLKETLKKQLIKGAKAYFSSSDSLDQYFITYGAKKEQIIHYPFTSIREKDICTTYIDAQNKEKIKQQLGITAKILIISIGQFIYRKGFDVLIKACKNLSEEAELYIIGGKPIPAYLNLINELQIKNIHFIEFKEKDILKQFYFSADFFVLPTREDIWGLVINEAMAYGLPVITTNKCVAGLELIKDDEGGFIIPADESELLTKKMNLLIENRDLREKMAYSNSNRIRGYTIESMAKRHMEVLKELSL